MGGLLGPARAAEEGQGQGRCRDHLVPPWPRSHPGLFLEKDEHLQLLTWSCIMQNIFNQMPLIGSSKCRHCDCCFPALPHIQTRHHADHTSALAACPARRAGWRVSLQPFHSFMPAGKSRILCAPCLSVKGRLR